MIGLCQYVVNNWPTVHGCPELLVLFAGALAVLLLWLMVVVLILLLLLVALQTGSRLHGTGWRWSIVASCLSQLGRLGARLGSGQVQHLWRLDLHLESVARRLVRAAAGMRRRSNRQCIHKRRNKVLVAVRLVGLVEGCGWLEVVARLVSLIHGAHLAVDR